MRGAERWGRAKHGMVSTAPGSARDSFLAASGVSIDLPLASPMSRAYAQVLDQLILLALTVVVGLVGVVAAVSAEGNEPRIGIAAVGLVLIFLLRSGYFVYFELVWQGQSPGKRAVGLRVVTDDGGELGFWHATVRNLVRPIDALPGSYGFGVVTALLNPRGKRLGDFAAGTVVVREVPPSDPWVAPEGFDGELARLLEDWFRRAPLLLPERREALAAELVALVEERRPGTFEAVPSANVAAELYWRFHPEARDGLR